MALIYADRVMDTSTSVGTGNITVAGVPPGATYQQFASKYSVGDQFYAVIVHLSAAEWEVSLCQWLGANQFSRITVMDGTSGPGIKVNFTGGTKSVAAVWPANQTFLSFQTSGIERWRIDNVGRLISGGNSAIGFVNVPILQVLGTDGNSTEVGVCRFTNSANSPSKLSLSHSRGTTVNSWTISQSGDQIAEINFMGSDGSTQQLAASIGAAVDGVPGTSDMPGRLLFNTTPDGSGTVVERMRINNAGATFFPSVGTTGTAANAFLDNAATPANSLLRSTSSRRFKTDIQPASKERASAALNLGVVEYKSLAKADNPDHVFVGMTAEDVAVVDPRLVSWGYRDEDYEEHLSIDDKGKRRIEMVRKPGAQLVPDSVMYDRVAILQIAALKEEIASLRNEIADLKK